MPPEQDENQNSQQTVVTENAEDAEQKVNASADNAQDSAAGNENTEDDFDALLNKYDVPDNSNTNTQNQPQQQTQQDQNQGNDAVAEQLYRMDMNRLVEDIRGDLSEETFDDEFIESWVITQAKKDPRLDKAWDNRHNDPANFKKVTQGLRNKLAKTMAKRPDAKATSDKDLIAQAVKGSSSAPIQEQQPDYSGMSDNQARKDIAKNYGYVPRF